ncbi:MAG: hypothetical protein JNM18_06940 [Planctomycetaceae bacterium]|nr:hypothetical protein [Planctomycetaceae bacterium]
MSDAPANAAPPPRTGPRPSFFDEQMWPINLALIVLAGFVAGMIAGRADFESPEGQHAALVQFGILGGIVVVTAGLLALLTPRQQRRVQLAALVSLLLHVNASVVMQHMSFVSATETPSPIDNGEQPLPVTLPDYQEQAPGETQPTLFTKPVDVNLPKEVTEELERLATTPTPTKRPTPVEPKQEPKLDPQPIELTKSEQADPKQAEKMQLPERAEPQVRQPEPNMQVKTPEAKPTPVQPTQQQPQVQVTKTQNSPQLPNQKPTTETPDRPAPSLTTPTQRTPQERQPTNDPQLASSQRTVRDTFAPAPQIAAPSPANSRNPEPRTMESQVRDVVRGATAAPALTPQAPQLQTPQVNVPRANAPGRSDARPQVDQIAKLDTARTLKSNSPLESNINVPSAAPGAARGTQANNPQPAQSNAAKSVNSLANSTAASGSPSATPSNTPSVSVGQPTATRSATSTAPGSTTSTAVALARSDTNRTTNASGIDAAAMPITGGANPDSAGSRNPAPVEVSGVANVGRTATRAASGQPNATSADPAGSTGPVTVASTVTGRPGSSSDTPSLSPGTASGAGPVGRSNTQSNTVTGTQVASIPGAVDNGGSGGTGGGPLGSGRGTGGTGNAPLNPALSGATQRGTGAGQPSLAGLATGAAPGGGGDPSATGLTGQGLGRPTGIGPRGDNTGGSPLPSVDVAGTGNMLGRSNRPGGTSDVPGTNAINVPVAGSGTQPNVTTPGRAATAGGPPSTLGPATSNIGKANDRPGVPAMLPKGLAGTGPAPTVELGQPLRRATRESDVVASSTPRVPLERTGGSPQIDGKVRDLAVLGLKQRDREGRAAIAQKLGGNADTERAVELGLDFLARHQSTDGSWSLHAFDQGRNYPNSGVGAMQSDTAATGLALLAFLGAGYTHTDGKYRAVVERGIDFLVTNQKSNGDLFFRRDNPTGAEPHVLWYYSHGMASIALCEAFGMSRDDQIKAPAQNALRFILSSQNVDEGGWRYGPRFGSDTSVSGWQLMALKSGELAGLEVPRGAYRLVEKWLNHAQGAGGNPSRYAYRPRSDQADQREPSHVMTAEALLMRQYSGWKKDNPNMVAGADWIRELLPRYGTPSSRFPYGERDAYYWYYATQVMFQMQGDHWDAWNGQLRSLLIDSQVRDTELRGSWDPLRPVPDRWGRDGGRIYVTCMHLLMLEVYYRHLPIYQTLEEAAND